MGSLLGDQGTQRKRERKDCTSQRGWRSPGKHEPPNHLNQGAQRVKQQAWVLHRPAPGPLHMSLQNFKTRLEVKRQLEF